ncbi:hypothetical protein [Longispora urticae]
MTHRDGVNGADPAADVQPSRDEIRRGFVALGPFVRRWNLSLAPEDVEEIVYAVLMQARSSSADDRILATVEAQIDQLEENARRCSEAMRADAERRGLPGHPD